jgi:hypothetical protein
LLRLGVPRAASMRGGFCGGHAVSVSRGQPCWLPRRLVSEPKIGPYRSKDPSGTYDSSAPSAFTTRLLVSRRNEDDRLARPSGVPRATPTRSAAARAGGRREIDPRPVGSSVGQSWRWHCRSSRYGGQRTSAEPRSAPASARVRGLSELCNRSGPRRWGARPSSLPEPAGRRG